MPDKKNVPKVFGVWTLSCWNAFGWIIYNPLMLQKEPNSTSVNRFKISFFSTVFIVLFYRSVIAHRRRPAIGLNYFEKVQSKLCFQLNIAQRWCNEFLNWERWLLAMKEILLWNLMPVSIFQSSANRCIFATLLHTACCLKACIVYLRDPNQQLIAWRCAGLRSCCTELRISPVRYWNCSPQLKQLASRVLTSKYSLRRTEGEAAFLLFWYLSYVHPVMKKETIYLNSAYAQCHISLL